MGNQWTASIDFQGQALQLRAERSRVLASNIANADTPNFKARDFDFGTALQAATGQVQGTAAGAAAVAAASQPARTNPAHLSGTSGFAPSPALQYRQPLQSSVDGNSVDLDAERAAFAENSVRTEATLRFLNGQIRSMMTAINGQ
jgi:flagellar basal-body rod protein FlgB